MPHKFDPAHRHRLCSRDRVKRLPPDEILKTIGLVPGGTFVDIGCGTGLFALPAARIVGPRGRVFGLDISRDMLDDLRRSAAGLGLKNIEARLAAETESRLPRGESVYFMANVFHELSDRAAYLRNIHKSMGPGSRLVIIDYLKKRTLHGPPLGERVSMAAAKSLLTACGFVLRKVWRVNEEEYGLIARPKRAR
jgi:ubiquinone/menaquinone biosynthesis C-methylase UbiE